MGNSESSLSETLSWLAGRGYYDDQIVHHRVVDGQDASTVDLSVDRSVASALNQSGIDGLYEHQVRAIESVRDDQHTVIATPTASGKSLAYVVPALERAVQNDRKTLYIAPYRALINDQAETMREFASALGFGESASVGVQTGDTSTKRRRQIKQSQPDVLLVTLDQLHYSLLRFAHSLRHWRWLFQQLETVVIDEVHMYRGVFGSHASLIFRRLNRLCEHYDTDPEYVCCSATIGNPVEHAAGVTGRDPAGFSLVDDDHSASGDRHYLFWNPPLKDESDRSSTEHDPPIADDPPPEEVLEEQAASTDGGQALNGDKSTPRESIESPSETGDAGDGDGATGSESGSLSIETSDDVGGGERLSNHAECVRLLADLVGKGYQTLVFTDSRQGAEQNASWTDSMLRSRGQTDLANSVCAYHAGLDEDRRRELEQRLREGDAMGVWSTKALELGIDIGTLDAVILNGYPGTRMQTFQRAGRAGRGDDECLVILVGTDNPLDQHALGDPDYLFEENTESAAINPRNDAIRPDHVVCAADEHYLSPADESHFGEDLSEIVDDLEAAGRLNRTDEARIRWGADEDNAQWETNIRDIDEREITIIDRGRGECLTSLEYSAALRDAHPESIFVHQKRKYRVEELDLDADKAYLESTSTTEMTKAVREKDISLLDTITTRALSLGSAQLQVTLSKMRVKEIITGYLHFDHPEDTDPVENVFDEPLPPSELETVGFHFSIPERIEQQMLDQVEDEEEYLGALHAIEHTLIALLPMEVLCDRRDVGGLSINDHPQTTNGTIFVHDGYTGGAGLTRTAFDSLEELLGQARETIDSCDCNDGCPSCIHSPHCGNANRVLNKDLAIALLGALTG